MPLGLDKRSSAPADKYLVLPVLLVLAAVAATLIIPDVAPLFFKNPAVAFESHFNFRFFDLIFLLLLTVAILLNFLAAFFAVRRRHPRRMISYATAGVIAILAVVNFRGIIEELQIAKVWIFPNHFYTCAQSAESYSNLGALKICSARTHGNSILTIVFDSGAQIGLPISSRSAEFTEFLRHRIGPLLSECEVYTRALPNNFFLVRSDCG